MKIEAMIKTRTEFDEIIKDISSIPRSVMGANDYLSCLRQRGKATSKDRLRFLLTESDHCVLDLFNPDGKLLDVDSSLLFDTRGKKVEWNLDNLYESYWNDGGKVHNKVGESYIIAPAITQYIRQAVHILYILKQEGCSALVNHRYEPYPARIYTTAVPIKIFKSHLKLI